MPRLGFVALVVAAACQRTSPELSTRTEPEAAVPVASAGLRDAQAALDELDARVPVPLLPMMANHQKQSMRDHLLAVQEIVAAVARDDFAAVEQAVARIGSSDSMAQMCTHMGAGAKTFTERALEFHRTADTIAEAAGQRDQPAVLRALGKTLSTCTSCHAAFKQSVVDEPTWNRLTAAKAAHGP